VMKLQVVEACAGLRYMFSLLSFGYICAYLYQVEIWKRVIIFLSTIPITILMNSLRIAIVGITVNLYGVEAAEGFTHNFQGIAVFSICLLLLFIEMWLLTKVGRKSSFRQVFGIDFSNKDNQPHDSTSAAISNPYIIGLLLISLASFATSTLSERIEQIPSRSSLVKFPTQIGSWEGNFRKISPEVIQKLNFSDYLLADYRQASNGIPVDFYIAYYETQRKGASPHSPRVCIPGGGWEISNISRQTALINHQEKPLLFNRAIIKKGSNTQLVYYWFQQRGRSIANEYLMKWYLLTDAIVRNRTDGALVRLVTPILPNEKIEDADRRLLEFASESYGLLKEYIPD
jgi:exosortase D (VPLPA-CTERM-specific)